MTNARDSIDSRFVPCVAAAPPLPAHGDRSGAAVPLTAMLEFIARHDSTINGLLVLRDESVVLESYRCPYRAETLHHLYSATKSLVSALIGIAINDGCIRDVDQPIVDLLPAHARPLRDPRTRAITVRHALTMTTGLDWAEARSSYANPRNPVQEMQRAPDWVRYVLDRRVVAAPGEQLNYNSGASHLLAAALQSSTGMSVASFAEVRLFRPLGISDFYWTSDPQGINTGGWGLHLRPRDMARFGELYLNAGHWKGREVVPEHWIRESTQRSARTAHRQARRGRSRVRSLLRRAYAGGKRPASIDFGYHWWIPDFGGFAALGSAGQAIYVLPEDRTVVVMTGGLSTKNVQLRGDLMRRFILPALRSPASWSDRPGARGASRGAWRLRRPSGSAAPVRPTISGAISGTRYVFKKNAAGIHSMSLSFDRGDDPRLCISLGGRTYDLRVALGDGYHENRIDARNALALRGYWRDERSFELEWCWLSSGERLRISLGFTAERLSFRARGAINGHVTHMIGRRHDLRDT